MTSDRKSHWELARCEGNNLCLLIEDGTSLACAGEFRKFLINNNFAAFRVCLSSALFVVAVGLRCFAGGVEIARVASSAPSWLFDFAPSTTFPSCRIGSYDILIGSNNGSSLAVKMYTPKITFRCRPSTFRAICDSLVGVFDKEVENVLKKLHILQFMEFPAFRQNLPLIYMLLSLWDVSRQAFIIKGHELQFTADEVALLIGLPNRGEDICWEWKPLTTYSAIDIKNEIKKINKSSHPALIVNKYIKFLLSNLFFPFNNYRTPKKLISVAHNINEFSRYNWAGAIRNFLVSQFDGIANKFVAESPLGYINGFVPLLMVSANNI
ncbi:hypothetical protein IEQ34_020471 [Dendrobium chrysotoxum]|uniref:Uncharacterized protein n=1 Tax=Dendrobium chrysotoxum TaxID=161865 RepID=A0AAV7G2F4_DENCH|nr:hypothetical protein IEQ34_020471 [Dendrobium chrysotoxum]